MFSGQTSDNKVIRCPVHGYISIPKIIFSEFIDTPIFQRLKNIEQTSMRPLYPSAFHNRFVHSLGVYHLARIAFHNLLRNTDSSILEGIDLKKTYEFPFLIAALMHDCGHAPFSHTLEHFYQLNNQAATKYLFGKVDRKFRKDYTEKEIKEWPAKAHEVFSAAIFLDHYASSYNKSKPNTKCASPLFVARMITGCTHIHPKSSKEKIENGLIKLLNGYAIDLDKLDYIVRDTWNSGVDNVKIDINRLLLALKLDKKDKLIVPVFKKSALSVIENVINGRNFFYRWIFNHHIVQYYVYILKEAVTKLFEIISEGSPQKLLGKVFSGDSFKKVVKFYTKVLSKNVVRGGFYLPSDDDLYSLIKQYSENSSLKFYAKELFSRKPSLIPLWKTREEFSIILKKNSTDIKRDIVKSNIKEILSTIIKDKKDNKEILVISTNIEDFPEIEEDKLFVEIRSHILPYTELIQQRTGGLDSAFFYVYIPHKYKNRIEDCIKAIEEYEVDV